MGAGCCQASDRRSPAEASSNSVLGELAKREEMIGVGIDGDKPFGKFSMAVQTAIQTEPDFESEEGVAVFIESVLGNPEKAKKSDPMQSLYFRVIKGLVAASSPCWERWYPFLRRIAVLLHRLHQYTKPAH